MKDIAFITDPDGYWIEILSAAGMTDAVRRRRLTGRAGWAAGWASPASP